MTAKHLSARAARLASLWASLWAGLWRRAARFLLVPAGTEALYRETARWARHTPAVEHGRRLSAHLTWPQQRSRLVGAAAAALLLGAALFLLPQRAAAAPDWLVGGLGALETLVGVIESIFTDFLSEIKPIALVLLSLLVGIELAVSAAKWGLQQLGISDILYRLAFKALIISMAFAIINDTSETCTTGFNGHVDCPVFSMEYIRDGFVATAQHVTGAAQPYYPKDVFVDFGRIVGEMKDRALDYGWFSDMWLIIVLAITMIVVFFEYIIIATKLFVLIMEGAIAISVGLLFVAFLGFRGTAGIGERYIVWILGISVELFLMNLLIHAAKIAIPAAYDHLIGTGEWQIFDILLIPLFAALFCGLVLYIPRAASRYLTSSMSLGIRNLMRL